MSELRNIIGMLLAFILFIDVFIMCHGFKFRSTPIKDYYGDLYPYVLSCSITNIGGISIISDKVFESDDVKVRVKKCKTEYETFNKILKSIGKVKYNSKQNNPSKVKKYGGNCQAYTLLLSAYLDKAGIEYEVVYGSSHMCLSVNLDDTYYVVDLVNGIFEEENDE